MQCPRHRQHEGRDLGLEAVLVFTEHLVSPVHGADRRLEHAAAGVAEVLAGCELGLLADHPLAMHLLHLAVAVGDDPVAGEQL
ncbi:hypothetical protein RZS08_37070, partial [Arthrospira platensis SPKY1]|nr:hypothetical protein [Arthrospira platensis SPKY1]